MSRSFLHEIETAAALLGISPATLCQRAVRNTRLPRRLAEGGGVEIATVERVRAWIRANAPARAKSDRATV